MIKLETENLSRLSFPDFNVLEINLSINEKILNIYVDGAYLEDQKGGGKQLGKGKLSFKNWQSFSVRLFNNDMKNWIVLPHSDFEHLKDICEFQNKNQTICLRGFGIKSGRWLEYKIENSYIDFTFDNL
jgi:hypothetical protein